MALKLLQPGIEPLGQFDLEDDDATLVVGGEVGIFQALNAATDAYAADVFAVGPKIHLSMGSATNSEVHGLLDEGSTGYGTLFGTVIGAIAGKGTGFGTMNSTGTIVVGPSTVYGSGKATLWTKPGLYGVDSNAWAVAAHFTAAALNDAIYGAAVDGTLDGKLTTGAAGARVATGLGPVTDTSLVSTTTTAAGAVAADNEFVAIYLLGVQN